MDIIKWSQVSDLLLITINLPNFEQKQISLDEKSLYINGNSDGTDYTTKINFLYEINTNKSSGKIIDNHIEFIIYKMVPSIWDKLTRQIGELYNTLDMEISETDPQNQKRYFDTNNDNFKKKLSKTSLNENVDNSDLEEENENVDNSDLEENYESNKTEILEIDLNDDYSEEENSDTESLDLNLEEVKL